MRKANAVFESRKNILFADLHCSAVPPFESASDRVIVLVADRNEEIADCRQCLADRSISGGELQQLLITADEAYRSKKEKIFSALKAELEASGQSASQVDTAQAVPAAEVAVEVAVVATTEQNITSSSSQPPAAATGPEEPLLTLAAESCKLLSPAAIQDSNPDHNTPGASSSTPPAPSKDPTHTASVVEQEFVYDSPPFHDNPFGSDFQYEEDTPGSPCGSEDSASVHSASNLDDETGLEKDRSFEVTTETEHVAAQGRQKRKYEKKSNVITPDCELRRGLRRRYATQKMDPATPQSIKDENGFKINLILQEENFKVFDQNYKDLVKLRAMYDPMWGEQLGKGKGIHQYLDIYVNPDGVGYVLQRKPKLGIDFFLNPQDALEYCAALPPAWMRGVNVKHE